METTVAALEWIQNVVFLLVAVWTYRRWRRSRTETALWAAVTFVVLGAILIVDSIGDWLPEDSAAQVVAGLVSLTGLVSFPYLLLRFHDTFDPVADWFRRALGVGVLLLLAVAILFATGAIDEGDVLFTAALPVLGATWVVTLTTISVRFWRAGRQQPTLVQRRLRLLAVATLALGMALILILVGVTEGQSDPDPALTMAMQAMIILAAASFLVGFAPPAPLRTFWRQTEERAFHEASVRLMGATTPGEVGSLLVPHLRSVLAARAVALVHHGEVLSVVGLDERDAVQPRVDDATVMTHGLTDGALHVWPNPYTPFFSDEESDLLDRLSVLTDLALARTGLLQREQEARRELEAANAELESFVYSASHDLKSPLIAIQSYLDIFDENVAGTLDEETAWYVERMRSNAQYMAALVGDLLELSRVGRVETEPEDVDLAEVIADVTLEVRERYPAVDVHIDDLPRLRVNPLRCHQLFRNLVENAAAHAPDGRVGVWVDARPAEDGDGIVVFVRDDGDGIPAEYRERIFGMFERLQAEGHDTGSTGIGLAICRKIVDGLGGRIWVTDHEGGAEFAVQFPAAALDGDPQGATTDNTSEAIA